MQPVVDMTALLEDFLEPMCLRWVSLLASVWSNRIMITLRITHVRAFTDIYIFFHLVIPERILTILEEQERARCGGAIRSTSTQVLVCAIGNGQLERRMQICAELWQAQIAAEFMYKENPKLPPQLAYADETRIPFAVIFGSDEIDKGIFNVEIDKDTHLSQCDTNSMT